MTEAWLRRLTSTEGIRANAMGATEQEILEAEAELGFRFPPSYRLWLQTLNDTNIGGSEIFSLAPGEFADDADTDIRYRFQQGDADERRLVFYAPNEDESWAFDLAGPRDATGEASVMKVDHLGGRDAEPEPYAGSFAGFIERLLDER